MNVNDWYIVDYFRSQPDSVSAEMIRKYPDAIDDIHPASADNMVDALTMELLDALIIQSSGSRKRPGAGVARIYASTSLSVKVSLCASRKNGMNLTAVDHRVMMPLPSPPTMESLT